MILMDLVGEHGAAWTDIDDGPFPQDCCPWDTAGFSCCFNVFLSNDNCALIMEPRRRGIEWSRSGIFHIAP